MRNTYQELRNYPKRQKNDCSIVALSITTGVTYETAATTLRKAGKKNNQGATIKQIKEAYNALGFDLVDRKDEYLKALEEVQNARKFQKVSKIVTKHHQRYPELTWPNKNKPQLWDSPKHVIAFVDGQVEDWTVDRGMTVTNFYDVVPA